MSVMLGGSQSSAEPETRPTGYFEPKRSCVAALASIASPRLAMNSDPPRLTSPMAESRDQDLLEGLAKALGLGAILLPVAGAGLRFIAFVTGIPLTASPYLLAWSAQC